MSAIEYVDCTCALEFLREIEEINPRFCDGRWIYRGHANASWSLCPKAFRDDTTFFDQFVDKYVYKFVNIALLEGYEREELAKHGVTENNYGKFVELVVRLEAEKKAVAAFCNLADRVGLDIPIDEVSYWSENPDVESNIRSNLGRFSLCGSLGQIRFALARHHGIPTRLLDWTFKPYAAAYFATQLTNDCGPNIAVWALDTEILRGGDKLHIIQHRRTQIGFLSAQDGVFVVDPLASKRYLENDGWIPIVKKIS